MNSEPNQMLYNYCSLSVLSESNGCSPAVLDALLLSPDLKFMEDPISLGNESHSFASVISLSY